MTPAQELRQAASHLRALAAKAAPGPWHLWDRGVGWEITELPDCHDGTTFWEQDARWIAAMSPAVAEPLAQWLEDATEYVVVGMHHPWVQAAVTFARAINGTETTR